MRATTLLAAIGTAFVLIAPRAQAAELVQNGGFQVGGAEVATGWSFTGLA